MTAGQLRSIVSVGSVMACSRVKFVGPGGQEFWVEGSQLHIAEIETEADGRQKPGSVPTVVVRLTGEPEKEVAVADGWMK